jgi:hypothetical protein
VEIIEDKGSIILRSELKNDGRFRFKFRKSNKEIGESYSTREKELNANVYLEWQIGYDRVVSDALKTTVLDNLIFKGANNKLKNPYELSEIIYFLKKHSLIDKDNFEDIKNKVKKVTNFLDEDYKIRAVDKGQIEIHNFSVNKFDMNLPMFQFESNELIVEIAIQKQQYASGVQPMLYLCIPVKKFKNFNSINGKKSEKGTMWEWELKKEEAYFFVNVLLLFSSCSKSHKHDILEIISLL